MKTYQVAALVLGWCAVAGAQSVDVRQAKSIGPAVQPGEKDEVKSVTVRLKNSELLQPPWPVKRVSVTEPKIADVRVLSPKQLLLQGKSLGTTDLIMWSEAEDVVRMKVHVEVDLAQLEKELKRAFPGAKLELGQLQDMVTVSGSLSRAEQARELREFLETAGIRYVDLTDLAGVQQVRLAVRVAEVSRRAIRKLGINWFQTNNGLFGASTIGTDKGGAINPISIGVPAGARAGDGLPFVFTQNTSVTPNITMFFGIPDIDLESFFQALAENQYMRVLAEPTLVALSGEKASFLAGGEFPIPVVQGGAGATSTAITIEYREFGVRLNFQPKVMGDGTIQLHVAPEVSRLSDIGAVEIQGFSVPSLLTRRAETTVRLKSDQAFAMAGLISREVDADTARVPGIGDLPVLGSLFRSVRYLKGETEMVVLVKASLVEPLDTAIMPAGPGALHVEPNDWELYLLGKVEGATPKRLAPADLRYLRELGLDRLRGPGAWARHGRDPAASRADLHQSPWIQPGPTVHPAPPSQPPPPADGGRIGLGGYRMTGPQAVDAAHRAP
ncbi:MAG: type II and III secretion system protein family protein [Planctomycetota bacterium]|jgi:pilus assembly protein CpaC